MLTHPTGQRLQALGLNGMAQALDEQRQQPDVAALSFEERLGLLVDREAIENLIIVGKTGLGKSWLACALAHKACRDDRSVLYYRVPRLFDALHWLAATDVTRGS